MTGEMVWLDGALVPASEARVSPFDRGFLYGDGLFETMRSYDGKVHLFGRHLARLAAGAASLEIALPSEGELVDAVRATLAANGAGDAVVVMVEEETAGAAGRLSPVEPGDSPATAR